MARVHHSLQEQTWSTHIENTVNTAVRELEPSQNKAKAK
jgi:hypothetical protein